MSSVEASYDQTTLRAETCDCVSIMSNARMRDTLDEYMDARYMGRFEAVYRLMGLEASCDQKALRADLYSGLQEAIAAGDAETRGNVSSYPRASRVARAT